MPAFYEATEDHNDSKHRRFDGNGTMRDEMRLLAALAAHRRSPCGQVRTGREFVPLAPACGARLRGSPPPLVGGNGGNLHDRFSCANRHFRSLKGIELAAFPAARGMATGDLPGALDQLEQRPVCGVASINQPLRAPLPPANTSGT